MPIQFNFIIKFFLEYIVLRGVASAVAISRDFLASKEYEKWPSVC